VGDCGGSDVRPPGLGIAQTAGQLDGRCKSNGQILVGGRLTGTFDGVALVLFARAPLNAIGTLDSTFGGGGIITTAFSGNAGINSLPIETNGDIVAVGAVSNPSPSKCTAGREYIRGLSSQ
jgi:hypothetical protein